MLIDILTFYQILKVISEYVLERKEKLSSIAHLFEFRIYLNTNAAYVNIK